MNFETLEGAYRTWLHLDHDELLVRLIFACMLANRYDGNPVWVMLVGPSGSGKTTLMLSLRDSPDVKLVSNLTPYALASGSGNPQDSLLFELDKKILVVEDMSAISEMPTDARSLLYSFLRAAYNGEFTRSTGKGSIHWRGKFGMLAGSTLAIEVGRRMETSLGERFLYVRLRMTEEHERTLLTASRRHLGNKTRMEKELQDAASFYLASVQIDPTVRKLVPSVVSTLERAAIALARARTGVHRDHFSKEILFPVESGEVGTRLFHQMTLVALAARAMGTDWTTVERMVYRLALDSMPYLRTCLLRAVHDGLRNGRAVAARIRVGESTTLRALEELVHLGILEQGRTKEFAIRDPWVQEALDAGT